VFEARAAAPDTEEEDTDAYDVDMNNDMEDISAGGVLAQQLKKGSSFISSMERRHASCVENRLQEEK
jgi:hypothetical protein